MEKLISFLQDKGLSYDCAKIAASYTKNVVKHRDEVLQIIQDYYGEDNVDARFNSEEDIASQISSLTFNAYVEYASNFGDIGGKLSYNDGSYNLYTVPKEIFDKIDFTYDKLRVSNVIANPGRLQPDAIFIHFPEVIIENEYNKQATIKDLWAKVMLGAEGSMRNSPMLTRSTYQATHILAGYMHSHCSVVAVGNCMSFKDPCYGSGPIANTIVSLHGKFDTELWQLFCFEFDKYVHIESIHGGPYKRIENIGIKPNNKYSKNELYKRRCCDKEKIQLDNHVDDFVRYFFKKKLLKFAFNNSAYCIGMSYSEFVITVSNCFIEYYNNIYSKTLAAKTVNELLDVGIIYKGRVDGSKIISYDKGSAYDVSLYKEELKDRELPFLFKGKHIPIVIEDDLPKEKDNTSIFLNERLCNYIATKAVSIINCKYGNNEWNRKSTIYLL